MRTGEPLGQSFRDLRLAHVEAMREADAKRSDQHGEDHQAELESGRGVAFRLARVDFGLRIADFGIRNPRSAIRHVVRSRKAWLEETLDGVAAAKRRRNADEARDDRADRQDLER